MLIVVFCFDGIFQNKKMTVWCLHIQPTWSLVIWGETNPEHNMERGLVAVAKIGSIHQHNILFAFPNNPRMHVGLREVLIFLCRIHVENYNSWFYVKLSLKQANIYLVLLLDWITLEQEENILIPKSPEDFHRFL